MAGEPDPAAHWDGAYALGEDTRSWFQDQPRMSLRMLDAAGVGVADSLIDVGGAHHPRGEDPAVHLGRAAARRRVNVGGQA